MLGLGRLGCAIGEGLLCGLAGTAAMTASSTAEAKLRERGSSDAPARATAKVLGIKEFEDDGAKARFNNLSHWGYGTSWGVARGLLGATGMRATRADLLHFAAVWGSSLVTLPALDVVPPVSEWGTEEIAIDVLHHSVYVVAAGMAYGLIARGGRC